MNKSKNTTIQLGPGGGTLFPMGELFGGSTALFVVLKVTGYISWSWWWVFAPLWLGAAIFGLVCLVLLILAVIVAILD